MIPIGGPYGMAIVKIVYRLLTGPRLYDGARLFLLSLSIVDLVICKDCVKAIDQPPDIW